MKTKPVKGFFIVLIILFSLAGIWVGITHLSFFDISEIKVTYSGPVDSLTTGMQRIINPYKGNNSISVNLKHFEHQLLGFDGVENVSIKRYFPNVILIEIMFREYQARVLCEAEDRVIHILADTSRVEEVSEECFNNFSGLHVVSIRESYAKSLLRWGIDNGFAQMCNLCEAPLQKNLITGIKYVNNNNDEFGLMVFELPSLKSVLSVREPVTPERLVEAVDLIIRDYDPSIDSSKFDLYSNSLVKRK